ncbi:hypothetical protein HAX54_010507 [Datura stramonium]|uniref:Pentatricopeptide repeat-containing protein n=1 Tax=Datura stramonium TaxID=4076 RepID=A0ABS8WVY3_DATST|nr:hypothetical protein [Datura stramonium]
MIPSVNTHVNSNANHQSRNPQNPEIIQEAERICKILLKSNDVSTKGVADALSSASVNVGPLLVDEVITKLRNSGVLLLSFFRWAEKQNGFGHTAESYHGMIEALGKIKQFKMVWILVDELKNKGLLCWGQEKNLLRLNEVYSEMMADGIEPGLGMFCNEDRTDMALRVWDQMKARESSPNAFISTLINSFAMRMGG